MRTPHLLNLGNPRKVIDNLSDILEPSALDAIENEIARNTIALFRLGQEHFRFAVKQSTRNWRQRISRLYFAAYNVSRAVRLWVSGEYSTEVKDHQRFDKLPRDFPSQARFVNQLLVLREDRNTCDYDHTARARDLVLGTASATSLVEEFLQDAETYLISRDINPRGGSHGT